MVGRVLASPQQAWSARNRSSRSAPWAGREEVRTCAHGLRGIGTDDRSFPPAPPPRAGPGRHHVGQLRDRGRGHDPADAMRASRRGEPIRGHHLRALFAMFPVIGYVLAARRPENSIGWLMLGIGRLLRARLDRELARASTCSTPAVETPRCRSSRSTRRAGCRSSFSRSRSSSSCSRTGICPRGGGDGSRGRSGSGLRWCISRSSSTRRRCPSRPVPNAPNPLGIEALAPFLEAAQALILVIPIGVIGSLTSLVLRFRRSSGIERLQLRWLLTAAVFVALLYAGAMIASIPYSWGGEDQPGWITLLQNIVIPSFALIPLAIGVSILRYRLFDIDVVINKAVLFGALAVFITARLRGDRRRRGRARREPGEPGAVGRGRGGRRARVPAGPPPGATVRRPAGLRQARDPVRGPVGVLGAGRADLRERGPAAEDGSRARGGDRRGARRRVGAGRRGAPVGGAVAGGRAAGNGSPGRVRRAGGVAFIRLRAGPPPGRAPRRPLDREEAR